jgi:hypothetical protein
MKNVFSIIVLSAISLLLFTSCSSDEKLVERSTDSFVELDLNFYEKSTKDSNLIEEFVFTDGKSFLSYPIFKITYDINTERLNKISFSKKFLLDNEISEKALEDEFNKLHAENKFKPNEPKLSEHASCIEWCNQNYTDGDGEKRKGRGRCKGNCWVDTSIRIAEALTSIIKF